MSIGFYMIRQCKLNCGKTQYFFYLFFMQFTFTWSGSLSYMFENVLCLYLLKYVEDKHYDWFICHLIIKSSLLILMCWGFLSLLNILIVSLLQIRHDRNSYGICFGLNEKKVFWYLTTKTYSTHTMILQDESFLSRMVRYQFWQKKLSFTLGRKNK